MWNIGRVGIRSNYTLAAPDNKIRQKKNTEFSDVGCAAGPGHPEQWKGIAANISFGQTGKALYGQHHHPLKPWALP